MCFDDEEGREDCHGVLGYERKIIKDHNVVPCFSVFD
jgi:hypothetical protein